MPTSTATSRSRHPRDGGAAAAATYSVLTVLDVRATVTSARTRASGIPRATPEDAEYRRFAQEQGLHLSPCHAQRPERPDLLPPGEHRHGHRVVDEEQAHEQRDGRQRRQVQVKRREHLLHLLPAPRRTLHGQAGRQPGGDGLLRRGDVHAVSQRDVDAVHVSQSLERPLRRRQIHQQEIAVEQLRGPFGFEQRSNAQRLRAVADDDVERIADRESVAVGERAGDHGRFRVGQQPEDVGRGLRRRRVRTCVADLVVADREVAEDVDAEDAEEFGTPRSAPRSGSGTRALCRTRDGTAVR